MVFELVVALEGLLTNLAEKLALAFLLVVLVRSLPQSFVLLSKVFLHFSKPFFFKLLLNYFHFLLFLLLPFFTFDLFDLLLLFFLLQPELDLPKTRVPLLYVCDQVLYGLNVGLLLSLALFLVLFLHLATHPAVASFSGVPLFAPNKRFVGGEIFPVLVKLKDFFFDGGGVTEALVLPALLLEVLAGVIGFAFLSLDLFEYFPVDCIEAPRGVFVAIVAVHGEVLPYIEAEAVLFEILFAHLFLVEENLFTVSVIPSPFVRIGEHVVGLVYFHKPMLGVFVRILVRVVLQSHLTVALLYLCRGGLAIHLQDLVVAAFHFNFVKDYQYKYENRLE